jgi:hypothetical protein
MTPPTLTSSQQERTVQLAQDYVRAAKQWPESDYHVEVRRLEGDPASPVVIVDAVHHDDLTPGRRGSNKSVQLHIDPNGRRVLKELAYQ